MMVNLKDDMLRIKNMIERLRCYLYLHDAAPNYDPYRRVRVNPLDVVPMHQNRHRREPVAVILYSNRK